MNTILQQIRSTHISKFEMHQVETYYVSWRTQKNTVHWWIPYDTADPKAKPNQTTAVQNCHL